jgi:hypothetical protein
VRRDKRGARRNPDPAAQTAWIDHIKDEVSVLAINIVDKEFKKVGISADGGVVKVSAPQGGLASRNSPYPCGSRKSISIVAALYLEVDFSAFTILFF